MPTIETEHLTKRYDDHHGIEDVTVETGEVFGLGAAVRQPAEGARDLGRAAVAGAVAKRHESELRTRPGCDGFRDQLAVFLNEMAMSWTTADRHSRPRKASRPLCEGHREARRPAGAPS